jgi:hypothetical protein
MTRALAALRILLLAAFLSGPLAQGPPREAWPAEAILRGSDSSASAAGYALPVARFQAALHHRSPIDRHGPSLSSTLLPRAESPSFTDRLGSTPPQRQPASLLGSSRHFPLFPTGPPLHG